jgi:hypothetical protein
MQITKFSLECSKNKNEIRDDDFENIKQDMIKTGDDILQKLLETNKNNTTEDVIFYSAPKIISCASNFKAILLKYPNFTNPFFDSFFESCYLNYYKNKYLTLQTINLITVDYFLLKERFLHGDNNHVSLFEELLKIVEKFL